MRWWESNPKLTPVFTLDYYSKIKSNYVHYSHNEGLRARVYQGSDRVKNSRYTYSDTNGKLYLYDTLNFNNVELQPDVNITLPDTFTFILKAKIHKSSLFLSINGSYYGLTYGTGDTNQPDFNGLWRVDGFVFPSDGKPESQRLEENNHLMFEVILEGNLIEKTGSMTVNGDRRVIPPGDPVFESFLQKGRVFTVIGYSLNNSTWGIKADVVAYGLFEGQVSETEAENIFTNIDNNFLKVTKDHNVLDLGSSYLESYGSVEEIQYLKTYKYIQRLSEPRFRVFNEVLKSVFKFSSENILVEKVFTIKDQVFEENEPVSVKVFLYDKDSGQLLKTTNSTEDGWFEFRDLDIDREYVVRSSDDKKQFKSVLKDYNQ